MMPSNSFKLKKKKKKTPVKERKPQMLSQNNYRKTKDKLLIKKKKNIKRFLSPGILSQAVAKYGMELLDMVLSLLSLVLFPHCIN
jgi:hypothetical protein